MENWIAEDYTIDTNIFHLMASNSFNNIFPNVPFWSLWKWSFSCFQGGKKEYQKEKEFRFFVYFQPK